MVNFLHYKLKERKYPMPHYIYNMRQKYKIKLILPYFFFFFFFLCECMFVYAMFMHRKQLKMISFLFVLFTVSFSFGWPCIFFYGWLAFGFRHTLSSSYTYNLYIIKGETERLEQISCSVRILHFKINGRNGNVMFTYMLYVQLILECRSERPTQRWNGLTIHTYPWSGWTPST